VALVYQLTIQLGVEEQVPYKSQSQKTLGNQLQVDANLQNIELCLSSNFWKCLDKTSKQC
jgi:hypothetical protein